MSGAPPCTPLLRLPERLMFGTFLEQRTVAVVVVILALPGLCVRSTFCAILAVALAPSLLAACAALWVRSAGAALLLHNAR